MGERHDIAIVGGGIVGAALALSLSRAGFRVALVERGGAPQAFDAAQYDPRVYAIAPKSAAFLDALGVWPAIAAARISAYESMRVWDEAPARALRFSADEAGLAQLGWIVEHGLIAGELWRGLEQVDVVAGVSVDRASFGDSGAELQLSDGRRLQARLLISAEGADSKLREQAGIDTIGWAYAQQALVCHIRTERPHRSCALQRFLPEGPLALLPLADGRCSIVWSTTEDRVRELKALSPEDFHVRLAAAIQFELGAVLESTPRLSFPLRMLHAQEYVRDGFALVGDSAHVIHPLAGQGVNLGLADAEALTAVLAEARKQGRDWAGLRTLKRYERARRPANLDMIAVTDGLYRAFRLDLPGWSLLLSHGMSAVGRVAPLKGELLRRALG